MKKFFRCQWYITILVIGMLSYSVLCWTGLIVKVGEALSEYLNTADTTAETISAPVNETDASSISASDASAAGGLKKAVLFADSVIDRVDSSWLRHMYRRSDLSRVDVLSTYYVTGEIASSQVAAGKDNKWLFYKSTIDGDPISDYEGTNRYSEEEKQAILKQALWAQSKLDEKGVSSVILVAPNKENIYYEYMPDTYTHAQVSSTDILVDFLQDNSVRIVLPKEEFLAKHTEYQLYYSYDTHWNQLGGYVGVRSALTALGIDMPDLSDRRIVASALNGKYHYGGEDDLAEMVGLRSLIFNDDTEYEVDGTAAMDWAEFETQQEDNKGVSHYYNRDAEVNATILLIGDSFRISMVPALREIFSDVYIVHKNNYTAGLIDQIHPEYVIIEYVER